MDTHSNHIADGNYIKKNIKVILLFAVLAAIIYTLSVYNNGLGLTDDSINYLHAASSFQKDYTLLKVNNTPFTEWPPLYPIVLSLSEYTPFTLIDFVKVIHCILYAFNIALALYLLGYFTNNHLILYAGGITLIFSTPLLLTHVFVWSEPLFVTLLLISIIFLYKYLNSEKLKHFLLLIVFSILLYLQRKSGLLFMLSHAGILLLFIQGTWKKRLLTSAIYLFPTLGIVVLWNLLRFSIAGKVFEVAYMDPLRIGQIVYQTLDTLTSWILPDEIPWLFRVVVLVTALIVVVYILKVKTKQKEHLLLKILFFTVLNYLVLLNLLLTYVHIDDPVDDRILSPVYIPAIIIIFAVLGKLAIGLNQPKLKLLVYCLLAIWLVYPVVRTGYHIWQWNQKGPGGYNLKAIINSDFAEQIMQVKNINEIYTNNLYQTYNLILEGNYQTELKEFKHYQKSEDKNCPCLFICYGNNSCLEIEQVDKQLIYDGPQGQIFKLE